MAPVAADKRATRTLNDFDFSDFNRDPFADSGDENQSKKRKNGGGLGIEEAVAVAKKARIPNVKLDEHMLLSEKGIPKLRRKARDLKFKGKGHEFSDTARLLSFYQLWLDDLFPKAKFLDALTMVEKTGHKGPIRTARIQWIDEGKPNYSQRDGDADGETNQEGGRDASIFPSRVAPIFETSSKASGRTTTPDINELLGEDDIYDATPKAARKDNTHAVGQLAGTQSNGPGNGEPDDEEDLDALMAEEEAQRTSSTSIFGNGLSTQTLKQRPTEPIEEDFEVLIADMDANPKAATTTVASAKLAASKPTLEDHEDDLDALMAEAEGEAFSTNAQTVLKQGAPQPLVDNAVDADEEEAMAELDGLW